MSEELPANVQGKMIVFGAKQIRRIWHDEQWFFSVVDIIAALTDSDNPRDYWYRMKQREKESSGIELSTLCRQLKLTSSDGKSYKTDVNCWHLGNPESEAMWRLYCPGNNGVAIQTSYSKLVESTANDPELYIGQVTYIDYESQGFPLDNIFYPVMHKRISFAHEQEVRLVKIRHPDNSGFTQEFYPPGISIDWPLELTIEAIYVDPYAPEYFYDVVRAVVRRIAPNLEGRVRPSQMRAPPIY